MLLYGKITGKIRKESVVSRHCPHLYRDLFLFGDTKPPILLTAYLIVPPLSRNYPYPPPLPSYPFYDSWHRII